MDNAFTLPVISEGGPPEQRCHLNGLLAGAELQTPVAPTVEQHLQVLA